MKKFVIYGILVVMFATTASWGNIHGGGSRAGGSSWSSSTGGGSWGGGGGHK